MNRDELHSILCAASDPAAIAQWLRSHYFPEITGRFNHAESRKRFGLYQGEKIPANERNLTDVRTRIGILIEFELARISNELLLELGIDDVFWSYVVANRFPDLEIRKNNGDWLLRLEIKSLQCVAEEKSANFDTLIKDINPKTDFVVVCLWDWSPDPSDTYSWDCVPIIYRTYVFHAYSLAALRDSYWLNRPPANLGAGFQGFDIRYAVTCANGVYAKEQGNCGKLTRIWKKGFAYRPANSDALLDTEKEYITFQTEIVETGFRILAVSQLTELGAEYIAPIVADGNTIGYQGGGVAYILSKAVPVRRISTFVRLHPARIVVSMTEKYKSSVYLADADTVSKILENAKPKNVVRMVRDALAVSLL